MLFAYCTRTWTSIISWIDQIQAILPGSGALTIAATPNRLVINGPHPQPVRSAKIRVGGNQEPIMGIFYRGQDIFQVFISRR